VNGLWTHHALRITHYGYYEGQGKRKDKEALGWRPLKDTDQEEQERRHTTKSEDEDVTVLFHKQEGVVYMIDNQAGSYIKMDKTTAAQMGKQVSDQMAQMQKMMEACKSDTSKMMGMCKMMMKDGDMQSMMKKMMGSEKMKHEMMEKKSSKEHEKDSSHEEHHEKKKQ